MPIPLRLAVLPLSAALLAPSAAAAVQEPAPLEVIMPADPRAGAGHEQYGYAQAVAHGDTLYLSGVVAGRFNEESEQAAYERTFSQIDAILRRNGSDLSQVIDMTTYHTDLIAQIDTFAAAKKAKMGGHYPAWTAIDVDRLLPDGGLVEVKIVARRVRPAS